MPSNRATVLCSYHYDALNRLTASAPSAQASVQRFYLKDRLSTEIQGAVQRSIMQHEDQLLAQRERQTTAVQTHLLATDQQRSVLNLLDASVRHPLAYTPYGHRQNGLLSLLGFNGERRDPVTGSYLLGNGYRAFNPVLMRFNSPDSWSPFGEGGLNAYGYCVGDPVNQVDPTGHSFFTALKATLKFMRPIFKNRMAKQIANSPSSTAKSASTATKTPAGIPLFQANGAPAGPPPRYKALTSETPFILKRDFHARPPTYDSLSADTRFTGEFVTNYPPEFSPATARVPPASRIQTRANNLTREFQSILDSIQDTPSPSQRLRMDELETFIRQLRSDPDAPIALPRYQK